MALRSITSLARAGLPARALSVAPTRKLHLSPRSEFLESRTGQTGVALLGAGALAAALSKEILILHNETIVAISVFGVTAGIINKAGGDIAAFLDDRAKGISETLNQGKANRVAGIQAEIEAKKLVAPMYDSLKEIMEINLELSTMLREQTHREMKHEARADAIKQLDLFLNAQSMVRKQEQDSIAAYLEAEILSSLKGKESEFLSQSISTLKTMSA